MMNSRIQMFVLIGLLAVSCQPGTGEMASSHSWEDDKMHESSDDTPRPPMGGGRGYDDRMHGRDDRMHGRDDRMHGRDDRMHGRDDRSHGRDDRPYHRDDSSPDYTPWWIRRRSSRPYHPGHAGRPFSPMFPRAWGGGHPPMRRTPTFPWGSGSGWGSHRSSSPFFPRRFDDLRESSVDTPAETFLSGDDSSTPSPWGKGWSDRSWGIPSRGDAWGTTGWWPSSSSSRDHGWGRPFWWDDSNFWRAGSPGWRANGFGWHDDDFRSRSFPFFPRSWRRRDPWSSDRTWGRRRWDDDFDGWDSRENDGDFDDWWPSSRLLGWERPSPWGRPWGRGFQSSYQLFDRSPDSSNVFTDPFSGFFGPKLLSGGGIPGVGPTPTPVTPGELSSTSPESSTGDDGTDISK